MHFNKTGDIIVLDISINAFFIGAHNQQYALFRGLKDRYSQRNSSKYSYKSGVKNCEIKLKKGFSIQIFLIPYLCLQQHIS